VDDAVAAAGTHKFILAPGCTMPSFTPRRNLEFLREYTLRATGVAAK
jgi:uroporphyrinogen decarboxylase